MAELAATKGNLISAKHSRALAENGFELMDKKRNILIREIMGLIDKATELQAEIGSTFASAYGALRVANISCGGCEYIAEAIPVDEGLELRYRSVMGVEIPTVISAGGTRSDELPYGLSETNYAVDEAYVRFTELKRLVNDLAETESAIIRLAYSIKKTQKRANALKNIVIPGLDADIARISDSLEEKEREEFVRLKVIKAQKS